MTTYTGFGLTFNADVTLPLRQISQPDPGEIDVSIYQTTEAVTIRDGRRISPIISARAERISIEYPALVAMAIEAGKSIHYNIAPNVTKSSVANLIYTTGLSCLLIQRNCIVLHAAALADTHGNLTLLLGAAGTGKSLMADALNRRSWAVLSDDMVAITPQSTIEGNPSTISLWKKDCGRLQIDLRATNRIRPGLNKYAFNPISHSIKRPYKLTRIVILEPADTASPYATKQNGAQTLTALYSHIINRRLLNAITPPSTALSRLSAIAAQTTTTKIMYPQFQDQIHTTLELIIETITSAP